MHKDEWSAKVIEKMLTSTLREQKAARRWSILFKTLFFGYLVVMLWLAFMPVDFKPEQTQDHVASIKFHGMIAAGARANAQTMHESLKRAFENYKVTNIILDINSPGGSAVQSDDIFQDIRALREAYPGKKIYAVISDVGASGAYYVASATDEIYANPSSLVGSIGVLFNGFGFTQAMEKIGVERRVFTAGRNKVKLDPFSPLKQDDELFIKGILRDVHQVFIDRVKQGRGDRLSTNPEVFSGMAYSGLKAKQLGLIDGFANVNSLAAEIAPNQPVVDYTKQDGLLERLAMSTKLSIGTFVDNMFSSATSMQGVQAVSVAP